MKNYKITKIECNVLWRKYIQGGLSLEQANIRLSKIQDHLKQQVEKWKRRKTPENEMQIKFEKEWEKVLLKADAEFD